MSEYFAFTKKEWMESIRTYKLLIILAVFLLFGMLNPITAKITPELLASFLPEGMSISIGEPSAIDSWMQFYKNMTGIQIIVFIVVFSGAMANELSKGTLVNVLTKGLHRKTVVLSKFTSMTCIWSLGYILCFAMTYGYTVYLLPGTLSSIYFAGFCMWLFGVVLIAVMLFGGVLFSSIYGSLLVTGGFFAVMALLNIVPEIQKRNPYMLASGNISLLTGQATVSDFTIPIIISVILMLGFLWLSIAILNKKQI